MPPSETRESHLSPAAADVTDAAKIGGLDGDDCEMDGGQMNIETQNRRTSDGEV